VGAHPLSDIRSVIQKGKSFSKYIMEDVFGDFGEVSKMAGVAALYTVQVPTKLAATFPGPSSHS
jgi:hypothetical protein